MSMLKDAYARLDVAYALLLRVSGSMTLLQGGCKFASGHEQILKMVKGWLADNHLEYVDRFNASAKLEEERDEARQLIYNWYESLWSQDADRLIQIAEDEKAMKVSLQTWMESGWKAKES